MSASLRRWPTLLAVCLSATCWLTACTAHPSSGPPPTFKPECVGRVQFALPDAEVAVVTTKAQLKDLKGLHRLSDGGIAMETKFADGQDASYSGFTYEGQLMISAPVSDELFKAMADAFDKQGKLLVANLKPGKVDENGEPLKFYPVDGLSPNERARRFQSEYEYLKQSGNTVFKWDAWNVGQTSAQTFQALRTTHERTLFTLPEAEQGVCLPYLFVPDNGKARRDIRVTYRLKEHPDITVWMRDRSGGRSAYDDDSKMSSVHYDIRFFWNLDYSDRKSVVMKENRPFRLAGIEGEYSVVELTRKDGTTDYGYFASAIDDPEKIADPTNLQMFVIRDARNAKARGIEPMPKDEFIQLAKAISATVQKRPVSTAAKRP